MCGAFPLIWRASHTLFAPGGLNQNTVGRAPSPAFLGEMHCPGLPFMASRCQTVEFNQEVCILDWLDLFYIYSP